MLLTGLVFIHLLLSSPGPASRMFKSLHLPPSISQQPSQSHTQGNQGHENDRILGAPPGYRNTRAKWHCTEFRSYPCHFLAV